MSFSIGNPATRVCSHVGTTYFTRAWLINRTRKVNIGNFLDHLGLTGGDARQVARITSEDVRDELIGRRQLYGELFHYAKNRFAHSRYPVPRYRGFLRRSL